ncbi:hypothetical protein Tco_0078309 [Tanacetum coccineum]
MGESSRKTSLERYEEQIEKILNHLDKLSLDRIEYIEDKIEDNDEIDIDDLYQQPRFYKDEMKRVFKFTSTIFKNLASSSSENTKQTKEVSTGAMHQQNESSSQHWWLKMSKEDMTG